MANLIRVSQAPVQVLVTEATPEVRVSQAPVQVLVTEATPEVRVSQASIQVLVTEATPEVRISQAAVQVLTNYATSIGVSIPVMINYGNEYVAPTPVVLDGATFTDTSDTNMYSSGNSGTTATAFTMSFFYKADPILTYWQFGVFSDGTDRWGNNAKNACNFDTPGSGASIINFEFSDAGTSASFRIEPWSDPGYIPYDDKAWHHILISGDTSVGAENFLLYIDGVDYGLTGPDYGGTHGTGPFTFDLSNTFWDINWFGNYPCCLSDLYIAYEALDISQQSVIFR